MDEYKNNWLHLVDEMRGGRLFIFKWCCVATQRGKDFLVDRGKMA